MESEKPRLPAVRCIVWLGLGEHAHFAIPGTQVPVVSVDDQDVATPDGMKTRSTSLSFERWAR